MMNWKLTVVLVCAFGAIKEFRPATPFLTPYLISPPKNFTNVQVYSQIYPFWTYSYMVALVPAFFLTDLLRYKPIVVLEAVALCVTWILLIWGKTIWQMQIMQIAFGVASASEIAYESYMFLIVDEKYYKLVSSYTRAATLIGRFFAYALAQFLVSTSYGSYLLLNQISFGATCLVIPIALAFPPITPKIIANKVWKEKSDNVLGTPDVSMNTTESVKSSEDQRNQSTEEKKKAHKMSTCIPRNALNANSPTNVDRGIAGYFRTIWQQFKIFKRNGIVLKWSIWWALTSCGIYQVINYVQSLWADIQTLSNTFNGVTECANTFIGALISFIVQYINVNWTSRGELILCLTSATITALLAFMSQSNSVAVSYTLYVGVIAIYNLLITAACANIASQLDSASYGLVFGFNTFVALLLETAITFTVADRHGFALSIREQFVVYSGYFAVIALIFLFIISWKYIRRFCRQNDDAQSTKMVQSTLSQDDKRSTVSSNTPTITATLM